MRDRPSWTAQSVATEILMVAGDSQYNYLVAEGVEEATTIIFKYIKGLRGKLAMLSRRPGFQRILGLIERLFAPNKALYLSLRKRWIEDQVRDMVHQGVSRVVMLGAGFDTLSYRLHKEFPQIIWVEVDHPATQRVKKEALMKDGHTNLNLQFLACDLLVDPQLATLNNYPTFSNDQGKTLFIAEGLFAYLNPAVTMEILRALHTYGAPGSTLIGTMNARSSGINPLIDLKLKLIGEPYRWGLASERMEGFLLSQDWRLREIQGGQALADRYLHKHRAIKIPEDEYIFTAVR
jgi:methyltransferase (TIGR00027 family)